jgi:hypothetical protein
MLAEPGAQLKHHASKVADTDEAGAIRGLILPHLLSENDNGKASQSFF